MLRQHPWRSRVGGWLVLSSPPWPQQPSLRFASRRKPPLRPWLRQMELAPEPQPSLHFASRRKPQRRPWRCRQRTRPFRHSASRRKPQPHPSQNPSRHRRCCRRRRPFLRPFRLSSSRRRPPPPLGRGARRLFRSFAGPFLQRRRLLRHPDPRPPLRLPRPFALLRSPFESPPCAPREASSRPLLSALRPRLASSSALLPASPPPRRSSRLRRCARRRPAFARSRQRPPPFFSSWKQHSLLSCRPRVSGFPSRPLQPFLPCPPSHSCEHSQAYLPTEIELR
mmetsp:Transcript_26667/g.57958  ORF Transcript_26667/g.57958 Transcript_26667/m.57958 type:complete len:281 (-) Transcript_26667:974-1816(-)